MQESLTKKDLAAAEEEDTEFLTGPSHGHQAKLVLQLFLS